MFPAHTRREVALSSDGVNDIPGCFHGVLANEELFYRRAFIGQKTARMRPVPHSCLS